jgi:hypothetical protein
MAAMAATGSNATTRQVRSNVPFEDNSGPDMLRSSSSLRDPKQTFIAQKQFVAAHIPLTPFQDPDRCDTMQCMV